MMHSCCAVLCCAVLCCAVLCCAVLCCAVLCAKPSLGGSQNTFMLLPLKLYIARVSYAVSCAPGQGLTADGAAFRAFNARICCLELLQHFAIDLCCTVDLQPPSRECAITVKLRTKFGVNVPQLRTSNYACMMLWPKPFVCCACRCSLCAMSERAQLGACEAGGVPGPNKM